MRRVNKERLLIFLALILFWSLILGALSSCGTTKTIVKEGERRIEWRDRITERRDSIYVHDSIYLTERMAGDTIYKVKEVYRWRDRERWRTRIRDRTQRDTIYLQKVDSVYVETQVKKTSAIADINSTLRVLGCTAIIIAIVVLILKIRRRWR